MKTYVVGKLTKEEYITALCMADDISFYSTLCSQLGLSKNLSKTAQIELQKLAVKLTGVSSELHRISILVEISDANT